MVDLTITAANVIKGTNASVQNGTAGEAVTAGESVYLDSATNTFKLGAAGVAATAKCSGIALHAASTGQPLAVHRSGDLTNGATMTAGTAYYLSATAGGVCPVGDLVTGDRVIQIGIAKSTTLLGVNIQDSGVTL